MFSLLWVVSWVFLGGFACLARGPDKHYPRPLSATNLRRRNRPCGLEQLNLSSAYLPSSTLHASILRGLGLQAQPTRDRLGWPAIPEWREQHSPLSAQ
eukprot:1045521-Amphidinium_carterae.1